MHPAAPRSPRTSTFLRRQGPMLLLIAVALATIALLGRGVGISTALGWEAAAAQGGTSTATPRVMPVGGEPRAATVVALPDAYRHIVPASAVGPAPLPTAEMWPAQ